MMDPAQIRALIVDDNAYARSATAATLRRLGVGHIAEAEGGAVAVALLASERFDVMFMDWYMPEISGLGLMHIVRDRRFGRPELPVILITAYASRENLSKAREAGVNAVLTKPFTTDAVMIALGQVLPSGWAMEEEKKAVGDDKFFL